MDNLLGEALLAVTGAAAALEPGPLRVTKAHMKAADTLLATVKARCLDAVSAKKYEPRKAPDALDYDRVLILLTTEAGEDRVLENVSGWQDQQLADAYAEALGVAWAYLRNSLPIRTRETLLGPRNERPADLTLARFGRAYAVCNRPLIILDNACQGVMPSRDELDAIKAVFPALWEEFGKATAEAIADVAADKGDDWLPSRDREAIVRVLLGGRREAKASVQAVHEEAKQAKREQATSTNAQREMTATQRMEDRG